MHQRAVVGEEKDAGGVLVEPADRLHAAPAQRRRQQRIDAGVMTRLLRALVSGRLVHDDEGALAIRPARPAAHPKPDLVADIELALEIVDDAGAFEVEAAARDQRGALATGAEALREEKIGRLHR